MDSSISIFVLLFLFMLGVQLFVDAIFVFLCFITGVVVLKLITFLNSECKIIGYKFFKDTYKTTPKYRKPMAVGFIVWVSFLFSLVALQ